MRTEELLYWIKERHSIFLKRQKGLSKPWTDDPIMRQYKFCNPYRENDRVTIWIREHIREPFADHPNLWFMLAIARRINWPDTLEELINDKRGAWPLKKYDPERLRLLLDARTERDSKVYGNAYMITAENMPGETKSRTTAYSNLGRLWEARAQIVPQLTSCESAFNAILGKGFAWGPFMTAQVVADLKYVHTEWPDWWTWAHSGPGSQRGMNIVCERPVDASWREAEWKCRLTELQALVDPVLKKDKMPKMHAQDLQNCLCEISKYVRTLSGGRPKENYPGVR